MDRELIKVSKFLSLVLRHAPEKIDLTLDKEGWVDVDDLITRISANGGKLNLGILKEVVAENNKKRFTFSDDGKKIRANEGHSIKVDLGLEEKQPPRMLFHGTVGHFLSGIREKGLVKGSRNYVHLSATIKVAIEVGKRRGKPIVLLIESGKMYDQGYKFYLSKNMVWLIDYVPVNFIQQFKVREL